MPELYDFQREDLEKLFPVKRGANGGEMGTGKTPFAVKLMEAWWEDFPKSIKDKIVGDLVVAPLNTFDGWIKRFGEWAPNTDVFVMPRTGQPTRQRELFLDAVKKGKADVYLTHWESVRLMPELRRYEFGTVTADEAHRMSNRKTQQTTALKLLPTYRKLVMSGTLSADAPAGLWSPFHWLYPKDHYLSSYWRFYNNLVDYEVQYPNGYHIVNGLKEEGLEELHEFMDSFYVRHLKREQCCARHPQGVMPWLKEKYYDRVYVELTPKQRKVYLEMQADMLAWVGEHEDEPLAAQIAMVKAIRLSQMCLAMPSVRQVWKWVKVEDPDTGEITKVRQLVDEVYFEPDAASAKLDAVTGFLQDHSNKQFVLWTSSKRFMDIAVPRLRQKGISLTFINGDVTDADRQQAIDDFVAGEYQCFFGMIQTSEGIDGLQHASDTAIFFDRAWSVRMNQQAEDRLHRDGQKNSVQIIDIMARNTVELGNHQRMERKWTWIKQLLQGKIDQETGD
jgi:SNF2 family DNA or RNA helicase